MSIEWNITRKGRLKGVSGAETRNLVIPDGVKEIGNGSFRHCDWLENVVIPEGVTRIGGETFAFCRKLKEIIIPESVNYIGHHAFFGTPWLNENPNDFVIVNHILVKYKGSAEEVTIPEEVITIGNAAAAECRNIRKLTFPEHLAEIKRRAFLSCENLTELYFPSSLKLIGYEAFKNCTALRSVCFSPLIKPVGISLHAFAECPKLNRVPIFVSDKKIFFHFPDKNPGFYPPAAFVKYKDYEDSYADRMLLPEIRYDLIFQIYQYHMDENGTEQYIRKHFPEMIPVFVRLSDENLIQSFIRSFPELVKRYIDTLIMEANQQGNHELQIKFMNYKYQHCEPGQKDLYL